VPAYYNDNDPVIVAWLEALIEAKVIADGEVDARSIELVSADDLDGFTQCHFFAGIGGWSAALRLAGWPDDCPVWTGSCPCQPFSKMGRQRGEDDRRHLWPVWARLIEERRPAILFGEQVVVASGRQWFAHVRSDLERLGYAVGAADLPACSVGAPHRRPRLYFVADTSGAGLEGLAGDGDQGEQPGRLDAAADRPAAATGALGADAAGMDAVSLLRRFSLHDPQHARGRLSVPPDQVLENRSLWGRIELVACADGWRISEPELFPLAHGVSGRVGRLRGYGNAIVPQVGAAFIDAYVSARCGDAEARN
jgi:DNA (cytosine-5)-methyltransferase 1